MPNENGSGAERVSAASVAAAAMAAGVDYLRFPAGAEGDEDRPPAPSDSILKQLIPRKPCTVATVAAIAVALLALLIAVVIVPAVWPADPEAAAAPVRTAAVVNIAAAIGAAIATGLAPVGGALSRM